MMSILRRMSRFNGSIFFMSRTKHARVFSRRHMGAHVRVGQTKVQRKMYRVVENEQRGIKSEKEARFVVEFMGNG